MELTETWFLVLSAILFALGLFGVLVRRNPMIMFMCIELMLNAVNISFVAFSDALQDLAGQTAVFFVLVVAAAEVVVGLSLVVLLFKRKSSMTVDDLAELKG
jgi:NADH-quinone oxidoreductase subunit K